MEAAARYRTLREFFNTVLPRILSYLVSDVKFESVPGCTCKGIVRRVRPESRSPSVSTEVQCEGEAEPVPGRAHAYAAPVTRQPSAGNTSTTGARKLLLTI
jgi:hypothetical protein